MMTLENYRPKLISGSIEVTDEQYFRFVNTVQNIKLPIHALKPFRLLDGSKSVSEIALKIYAEEKNLSFRELYSMLKSLATSGVFEDSLPVIDLLRGQPAGEISSANGYESRFNMPFTDDLVDVKSRFLSGELSRKLSQIPLFRDIDQGKLIHLLDKSKIREFAKGLYVVREGTSTDRVFILLTGSVSVYRKGEERPEFLATLFPNSVFGEYSAFLGISRTADVVTQQSCHILVIDVEHLRQQGVAQVLEGLSADVSLFDELKRNVILAQTLRQSKLFESLPLDIIQLIIASGTMVSKNTDDVIIREGDIGKSFYLVVSGGVSVFKDQKLVNKHTSGEFFGEISLIKRVPRTATVQCNQPSLLLQITKDNFYKLLSENFFLAIFLEREAESRLKKG